MNGAAKPSRLNPPIAIQSAAGFLRGGASEHFQLRQQCIRIDDHVDLICLVRTDDDRGLRLADLMRVGCARRHQQDSDGGNDDGFHREATSGPDARSIAAA